MTTIICPIDFSPNSINAAHTALILSKKTGAQLEFLHLTENSNTAISERLKVEIEHLGYQFGAQNLDDFGFTVLNKSLISYINDSDEKKGVGLVVIGTNGISSIQEFYKGSNTEKIAGSVDFSVLIIPESFNNRAFENIMYLTDYEDFSLVDIESLLFFIKLFDAKLEVVHFSAEETEVSKKMFNDFVKNVKEYTKNHPSISFTREISSDKENGLMSHLVSKNNDLVVVHKKNFESNDGSKTDLLTKMAAFPLLILR